MNRNTPRATIHQTITEAQSVVILPHTKPDGDCLGSSIALSHYLQQLGISTAIYSLDPVPNNLSFLDTSHFVTSPPEAVDLVISIDSSDAERLDERLAAFRAPLINIDHHATNQYYGDYNLVEATASTGEIIYSLLREWQAEFTPAIQEALYTAIVTDTNRFYYRSTTAETLRAVAYLMDLGLKPVELNNLIYGQVPLAKRKLQAQALLQAEFLAEGQLITSEVNDAIQAEYNCWDTDDIVENLRDTAGVEVALLRYSYQGEWRFSLRSKSRVNVGAIAKAFGGGGHFGAAGIGATLEEYPRVLAELIQTIEAAVALG